MARRHEALEFAQLQTPTHPFSQGTVSISEEGGEVNCTDAATGKMEFSSDRFFFPPSLNSILKILSCGLLTSIIANEKYAVLPL